MDGRITADACQGVVPRFGALFIDALVLSVVGYPVMNRELLGAPYVVLFGIMLVYFTAFESVFGTTPGKKFFGLKVVTVAGDDCGPAAAVIRNLVRVIDQLFLYLVGAAIIWSSPKKQRLGDRAAGTVVIKE